MRNAVDQYTVEIRRENAETAPVLVSNDPQTQIRLDNLSELVKLQPRWRQAIKVETGLRQRSIDRVFKRQGHALDENELCTLFEEWAEGVEQDEKGYTGFALARHAYLQSVANRNPFTFDEAVAYAQSLPVP